MKTVNLAALLLLLLLQYDVWFGHGAYRALQDLKQRIAAQEAVNERLQQRNERLYADVINLREKLDSIEARARTDLGMIKKGETFFWIIPK